MKAFSREKIVVIIATAAMVAAATALLVISNRSKAESTGENATWPCTIAQVGLAHVPGRCVNLEVVSTSEDQAQGLSGRDSLGKDKGMLFVFGGSAVRCFWMHDMKFNIDIVWLDEKSMIVAKEISVSPDTYPESFCPEERAKYVIEVNANAAKDWPVGYKVDLSAFTSK